MPDSYIDQVALDFPELTIVGGHIGYPWTEEMIAVCRKHENVYIDASAYTSKRLPPELVAYMKDGRRSPQGHVGSNYPMIPPAKALEGIAALELDEEAPQLYLEGNARRVFDCG
jgi:predicted TIM-barrel fold metal-dependent hydrolase